MRRLCAAVTSQKNYEHVSCKYISFAYAKNNILHCVNCHTYRSESWRKIHSSAEAKLRSLGRLADAGKVSLDDMVSDIDRICGGYLERKEKEELAKALKRYM